MLVQMHHKNPRALLITLDKEEDEIVSKQVGEELHPERSDLALPEYLKKQQKLKLKYSRVLVDKKLGNVPFPNNKNYAFADFDAENRLIYTEVCFAL